MEFLCFLLVIAVIVLIIFAVKGKSGGRTASCPVCDEQVELDAIARHNLRHAVPTKSGDGFMWQCPKCDDLDGVWPGIEGAAAGLTDHMRRRHQIYGH